jgi:hypothetical protein
VFASNATLKVTLLACTFALLLGAADYLTGDELNFFAFYFLPMICSGWFSTRPAFIATAAFAAAIWILVDWLAFLRYSSLWLGVWDAGMRMTALVTVGGIVHRIRTLFEEQRRLSAELQNNLRQVKELSGLLPICAGCKKIRNDAGYWEQIEAYLSQHSKAQFSHGLCPECLHRLYPEIENS